MPHRILILDKDPAFIASLDAYLGKALGYEVLATDNSHAALDAALQQPFDLCILDVALPGMTGPEVYTRLKNIQPALEAIFFTPAEGHETKKDFLQFTLPQDRVLVKPLPDFSHLTRLIIGILGPPNV